MYKKGTGNDKQGKDAGNRTLSPYRNFSKAIRKKKSMTSWKKKTAERATMILRQFSYFIGPRAVKIPKVEGTQKCMSMRMGYICNLLKDH